MIPSVDDTATAQPDETGETGKPADTSGEDSTEGGVTGSLAGTFAAPTDVSELRKRAQEGGSFGGKAKPVSRGGPSELPSPVETVANDVAPRSDRVSNGEAPQAADTPKADASEVDDDIGTEK